MAKEDPILTILNLLESNWDNSNTSIGSDPAFHTGWHNTDSGGPQVTVTNPDEGPINGGQTGYSAIDPTGGGGIQHIDGTVNVDCWADREVTSENPKKLTFEFTEEIRRIVKGNQTGQGDLIIINYGGRTFVPPGDDEDPPTFHYNVPVGYTYESRP